MQTNTYTYGDANWKDKLTAFNGTAITYDAIGNPLNDGTWNHTWVYGRRMRSSYKGEFGEPGYDEITYEYNADGVRTRKTRMYYDANVSGGIAYQNTAYMVHGSNLVHMIQGNDNLHFFYDAQNSPAVVEYNGVSYGYVKNLQGDIIAIVNASGTKVVEYVYDAWGKLLSKTGTMASTLGTLNPFRYRGYVYDEETGLYYLNNRYYNPNLCRFINADAVETLGAEEEILGNQLFSYCQNDPINRMDALGAWSLPNWAKVAIGAALIVGAVVVATVATGGVACFAAGAAVGAAKGAVSGAVGGAITGAIQSRIENGNWDNALDAAIDGAADGFLGGAIGGFISGGITSKACFVAGTQVYAECGLMPIEQIEAGQLVWAEDPDTGERALKRVVRTFLNEKDELVHVHVNGEVITCTTEHPFYVHGKGWVAAKDLKVNDRLELHSGQVARVTAISKEKLAEPIKVYNFEVEEFHTYFVGKQCVLVHNLCKTPGRSGKQARLRELMNDDKLSRSLRGEIKRDYNAIIRGTRKTLRVPQGYDLAHRIGQSAKDGYSYLHADLNMKAQHVLHHKYFGY